MGFLTAGKAGKAIFWTPPGLKEITFDDSGFSAEGTIVYIFAVPQS